jgi:branched-chain amino acid aminotransferase
VQYFVCPISQIHHRGRDVNIPMGPEGQPGEITGKVKGWLGDIMYGRTQHEWGVVIPEKE